MGERPRGPRRRVMARTPYTAKRPVALESPRTAESHAPPIKKDKLMDKVTQSPATAPAARKVRTATSAVSPRLIEEASRVFLALGITAADLRLRATPRSALAKLADALDAGAGTP